MKFGILCVPYALAYAAHEESLEEVIAWDLQVTRWAEQYGIDEVFYAEHHTLGHEPSPAPDLMIAAASQQTSRVKLGALGHLLPYHHPVALAHRMLWLDHMTAGRYIAGVAPGAFPSDARLFGTGSHNHEMLIESLDIIHAVFRDKGPWTIEGKYWTAEMPSYDDSLHGPHLKAKQLPYPEIVMTGMQPNSPTLRLAGQRGFSPVSQEVSAEILRTHWATYEDAARQSGHTPLRENWRIVRDYWVAETDEQARDDVFNGPMGETWEAHNLPVFTTLELTDLLVGPNPPAGGPTLEWLVDNFFLVGSPETVAAKIEDLYQQVGGFGTLLMAAHGRGSNPGAYRRSLELIGAEVAPRVAHLKGV